MYRDKDALSETLFSVYFKTFKNLFKSAERYACDNQQ